MASRLRIARADPSGYAALSGEGGPTADLHHRLQAVIRRHLPTVNASLLAAPSPMADGRYVEWYSDLSGQPRKLTTLPEAEQASARAVLKDRLNALQGLAERLPGLDPGASDLAESLRWALSYPGDDTVYVVGDQPVITFWGHQSASGTAPSGPSVLTPVEDVSATIPSVVATTAKHRFPRWLWPFGLLLPLGLLAVVAWWYSVDFRWPPWIDYKSLIAAAEEDERAHTDRLAALEAAIGEKLEECRLRDHVKALEARVAEDLRRCSLRAVLDQARAEEEALRNRVLDGTRKLAELRNKCWCEALPPLPQQVRDQGDLALLDGRWKSITPHWSVLTKEGVEIVLDMRRGAGQSTYLVGSGAAKRTCPGRLRSTLRNADFVIRVSESRCGNRESYVALRMTCSLTPQESMVCCANNGNESFGSELVRDK